MTPEVLSLLERLVKAVEESNQLKRIEMRANGTLPATSRR
jgi:hypothetical protein